MEQLYENVKLQQIRKTKKYKDENCKKNKRISLRITKHQHEEISKLAKNNGLTVTQYMISKAFEQPRLKFDIGKEIAVMSESINQINRDHYAMGDNPSDFEREKFERQEKRLEEKDKKNKGQEE